MTEVNKTLSCTNEIIHQYPCTQLKYAEDCLLSSSTFVCLILFICTLGLIGNGTVAWLLGFRIKRNFFSVYVLNLAVADFGVLTAVWSLHICIWSYTRPDLYHTLSQVYECLIYLFFFALCLSIQFLTAISVDRCLVILFPVWQQSHRPKNLSAIVSCVLWGITCILLGLMVFISCWKGTNQITIASFVILVSVTVVSTVILFFKVCCNSRLRQHGRVHIAILLALLFFVVVTIPISLFVKVHQHIENISSVTLLFICMNSSINPIIYFLIGRYRSLGQSDLSIKDALRRLFKEEEDHGNEERNLNLNAFFMSALHKIRPLGTVLPPRTGSCPLGSPMEEVHAT